uniref:Legume lectin domain-containing protein n=1 Tax=Solanum lycopersicum TaxID=4081 RepID=A0A3Q7IG59_SOLLC
MMADMNDWIIYLKLNENDSELSIGRATYSKTLYLWDKASVNVTDFSTHFSFRINSQGRKLYVDGLTFFLSPTSSVIPDKHFSAGEGLGLASVDQQYSSKSHHFVVVEFDIFWNSYDPQGDHVGIDINSMQSVANVNFSCGSPDGTRTDT